ncbi:hypothetical protein Enr10x_15540 [Gimesia panareensis]|uniref:Uncharacterized protein n=2 Tax=Gimesia panareensis TaxID=2527978 RepID=A0A518A374_9PLAN|nr:hypothetical protein Enr10x_15540 [Gimesia panareensis]QDU49178.1 hypothetical protein Pan110_14970 [Gimesia panareensis]
MEISMASGRRLVCCLALFIFTVSLPACGGPPSMPPPTDSEQSEVAQKSIDDFIAAARKEPKQAAQKLSILMESLEAYASEFQGPYVELRDEAKKLLDMYQNSAAKEKIDAQLDVFKQKSDALSGGASAE